MNSLMGLKEHNTMADKKKCSVHMTGYMNVEFSHSHFHDIIAMQKCQAAYGKPFLESRLPVSKGIQKDA